MHIYISPDKGTSYLVSSHAQAKSLIDQGYTLYEDSPIGIAEIDASDSVSETDDRLNINTASLEELKSLGLTIATAKLIEKSRPYESTSAIANINGVELSLIIDKIKV